MCKVVDHKIPCIVSLGSLQAQFVSYIIDTSGTVAELIQGWWEIRNQHASHFIVEMWSIFVL